MTTRPAGGKDPRHGLGAAGERLARQYLERMGYEVLETNYRTRSGELDIVALEGGCLVGIEVRTKRGDGFGSPEESITRAKARRLAALIEEYASSHPERPVDLRVDVVAVAMSRSGVIDRVDVIQNAVTE